MIDLSARVDLPEQMDGPEIDEAVYQRCLRDLAMVNRVTFTHRAAISWLNRATKNLPQGASLAIFDVAYGHGDLLRAIARWAQKRGFTVRLSGIDLNPRSAAAARLVTPVDMNIDYLTGDVFDYVPDTAPDFIVTSQFTHHLTNVDLVRLLWWLEQHATRGWHITDLHRHVIAYFGFPVLASLMSWHPIVRYDGQISVARSFTSQNWRELLQQAELTAEISWRLPFRHGVSRLK
ncbi:MAG: methyltransferase domain-containing protein [Acidocella sp.]|nr:methyltransferase domain-containing protein [Acidocella sp.]